MHQSRRCFLLGEAGTGKSTVLQHLAVSFAADRIGKRDRRSPRLIPVFVNLVDWAAQREADAEVDLLRAAVTQLALSNPEDVLSWLQGEVQAGRAILLLDGLNEVAKPDLRAEILDRIRAFIVAHQDVPAIICARTAVFDVPNLGAEFDTYVIESLPVESIERFIRQWYAVRHGHETDLRCQACANRLESVRQAIVDYPALKALAVCPSLLTILLMLHETGAALPQRRHDLYGRMSEILLLRRQERGWCAAAADSPRRASGLDDRELAWLLESLALQMQWEDTTVVARWWLHRACLLFLQNELDYSPDEAGRVTDALIRSFQERPGLLIERGPDRFGFGDLALQEHFAARAVLASPDPVTALQRYRYHPCWREVVREVGCRLDRRRATALVRDMLDDPDPTGRFIRRGLLLALACLADGAPVTDRGLLNEIALQTVELGRTGWPGLCRAAADVLATMTGGRLDAWAASTLAQLVRTLEESPAAGQPATSCPDDLATLQSSLDAREMRHHAVSREEQIKQSLVEFLPRIETMFIFGSCARHEQGSESDIDLMVVGRVSLKDLVPGLREAEQALGRQVNAVVYSRQEWARRCKDRNPFVIQVLKDEKIFIQGGPDELAAMAGQLVDHAD